jgi:hypothetical protein
MLPMNVVDAEKKCAKIGYGNSSPKGAKQGEMSDVEKERILGGSARQPASSFSCWLHAD